MSISAYATVTTLLTLLGLAGLLSLRFVGLYSHQALAVVLLLGCGWAVASRARLAWKGRLHLPLPRGFRERDGRARLLQAAGRASFWAAASAACLAVFPRSAEMTPLIVALAGVCVLRTAASFLTSHRTNAGPTLVMAAGALVLAFDLGRAFTGGWMPRKGKGSHRVFTHPTKSGIVVVPHPRKDLMVGTLRNIHRQAGWVWGGR